MKILRSKITFVVLVVILVFVAVCLAGSWIIRGKIEAEFSRLNEQKEPYLITHLVSMRQPQSFPFHFYSISRADNAAPLYSAAMELADRSTIDMSGQKNPAAFYRENEKEIRFIIKKEHLIFELLAMGFSLKECQYDLHYEDGFNMRVPNYLNARYIVQLSAMKAYAEMDDGMPEEAARTLAYALKFTRTLQPEIFFINHAMMTSLRNILAEPLKVLTKSGYNGKYSPLQEEVARINRDGGKEITRALRGERALAIKTFDDILANKNDMIKNMEIEKPFALYLELYLPGKPFLLFDELFCIRAWGKVISAVKNDDIPSLPAHSIPGACIITSVIMPNVSKLINQDKEMREKYREIEKIFPGNRP
jgi:hypothetical protein